MGDLTTTKPFEVEVRFSIPDFAAFKKRVDELKCELLAEYSTTDYYYQPVNETWDSQTQTLRIRQPLKPAKLPSIYLTKDEVVHHGEIAFKRSTYPEGKVKLFTGELEICRRILDDLGFKEVFRITKKQGWVWQNKELDLEFCAEETDALGWSGEMEIEGRDLDYVVERVKRHQQHLQLADSQLSYKTTAAMLEEQLGVEE